MPSYMGQGFLMSAEFHPMCGILSPISDGKRFTFPFNMPSPKTPGLSSEESKRSCSPRQIPKNGLLPSAAFLTASQSPLSVIQFMASPNEPTPGKMQALAFSISDALLVTRLSAPMKSRAFFTLCKFPAP